ncbi:selenocysteine-specific translation elongation factor [Bacillus alkalisoli]|uniref:selenocysteine-specific translation elongation factor n=1 Tax=Bacillus alkalisoli TaxID=2011008 RepID=UPI0012FF43F9|nr:selenocysteine-specific translation elongation factor [Bacillus alkalisoli]
MDKQYTVGIAGHIDHGKTSLVKKLTGIDTDRLKEEKERQISIELGFAPLALKELGTVSIIDVPGHERFIRQMIAGVSGIDLVILVVAADEGVMPQTREHLQILKFLEVPKGIIAITKIDKVEKEFLQLVKEEILEELEGTIFQRAKVHYVNNNNGEGLDDLTETIATTLQKIKEKDTSGNFRLPIDQVFTLKGQGTIVRGTIVEGAVSEGDTIEILPAKIETKVRQLQVHNTRESVAVAGQRVAINLPNLSTELVRRGDVLSHKGDYKASTVLDVSLQFVPSLKLDLKQRSPIRVYIGTREVDGKIVFFDRNTLTRTNDEVICQVRLEEEVVAKRGDKLIIRRPSPSETIGGGWIINPNGDKYKFGNETIHKLERMKEGTIPERVKENMGPESTITLEKLTQKVGLGEDEIYQQVVSGDLIKITPTIYTTNEMVNKKTIELKYELSNFHLNNPLKEGIQKAELTSLFQKSLSQDLFHYLFEKLFTNGMIQKVGTIIALTGFRPSLPPKWEKRLMQVYKGLERDGIRVDTYDSYVKEAGIPESIAMDYKYYLLHQKIGYELDNKHIILKLSIDKSLDLLMDKTGDNFTVNEAKAILDLSRKYVIPYLELLDRLTYTERNDSTRTWIKNKQHGTS